MFQSSLNVTRFIYWCLQGNAKMFPFSNNRLENLSASQPQIKQLKDSKHSFQCDPFNPVLQNIRADYMGHWSDCNQQGLQEHSHEREHMLHLTRVQTLEQITLLLLHSFWFLLSSLFPNHQQLISNRPPVIIAPFECTTAETTYKESWRIAWRHLFIYLLESGHCWQGQQL